MSNRAPWYRRLFTPSAAQPGPMAAEAQLVRVGDAARALIADQPPSAMRRAWDTIQNLVAGLMDGFYDKTGFSRFMTVSPLSMQDVGAMYRGDWIAKRVVNTVADDMTRAWIACTWDGKDTDEEGADELEEAEQTLQVRAAVNQALRWARAYGGGGFVMGVRGQDLAQPLDPESVTKGSLAMLYVVDRWRLAPTGELDGEIGPHFGQPLNYILAETSQVVHWTRLILFDGAELPWHEWRRNGFWHDSELQVLVQNVRDYASTRQAIASLVYESTVDVVKVDGLGIAATTKQGEDMVKARFRVAAASKSINRVFLLDKEDEYEQKTVAFSGVTEVLEKFMVDICGAADIPMTRLFGRSPGGLNSTGDSDLRNYYDHVAARQEKSMRAPMRRLYEVLVRSALGRMPKDFTFIFEPLWQTSDLDRSIIDKNRADTDTAYVAAGAITEEMVARELKDRGTYRTMKDEDIAAVAEAAEAKKKEADAAEIARAAAMATIKPRPAARPPAE